MHIVNVEIEVFCNQQLFFAEYWIFQIFRKLRDENTTKYLMIYRIRRPVYDDDTHSV